MSHLHQDTIDWSQIGPAHQRLGSRYCLICGRSNPHGLQAAIQTDGRFAWLQARPPGWMQGFVDILHGGLVTALMDEVMWYALFMHRQITMTAGIEVRFRRPVTPETLITAQGAARRSEGRLLTATARIVTAGGEVLAEAEGRFAPMNARFPHLEGELWRERVADLADG